LNWLLLWFAAHYHSVQALKAQEMLMLHFQRYCYELILHLQYLQSIFFALLLMELLQHLDFYCWHPIHMA
jgi:hypothetical protein